MAAAFYSNVNSDISRKTAKLTIDWNTAHGAVPAGGAAAGTPAHRRLGQPTAQKPRAAKPCDELMATHRPDHCLGPAVFDRPQSEQSTALKPFATGQSGPTGGHHLLLALNVFIRFQEPSACIGTV